MRRCLSALEVRAATRIIAAITFIVMTAGAATAQGVLALKDGPSPGLAVPVEPPAWGLSSDVVQTIYAHNFGYWTVGSPFTTDGNTGAVSCNSVVGCSWLIGLQLPSGASLRSLELSACDGDAMTTINFAVFRGPKVVGATLEFLSPVGTTGVAETPGCTTFPLNLLAPHTVDNNGNFYLISLSAGMGTNMQWSQMRVKYRLQVSPAPGMSTFNDVPVGHPQRQFIEALVASGITGGCGGGNFCPDAFLTRGQMAVFLAAALGLHWPN